MEEVLDNIKKYLHNGKIVSLVIAIVFVVGNCILNCFIDEEMLHFALLLFIWGPVSFGIAALIRLIVNKKVERSLPTLVTYNKNTTVEERESFINNYKKIPKSGIINRIIDICIVPFVIVGIIGFIVVVFSLIQKSMNGVTKIPSLCNKIIYTISPFIFFLLFSSNRLPNLDYCPKCYSFSPFSVDKQFDGTKRDIETKWEDHYGETAGVYLDGEKIGSIHGRTGSTRYEREVTEYRYKYTTTCKYCGYQTEKSTSEYIYGAWK